MDINILTLVISFLGGGFTSAIITQLFSLKASRRKRELEFFEKQMNELYGPLFYLVCQSEKLFELNKRFHDAYKVEFIDKKYSDNELTQQRLSDWATTTIGVANQYVKQIEVNNAKLSEILDSKFSYIDADDIELFLLFFEHHIRLNTEKGELKAPLQIYEQVGDISYLRPEFIERVKSKFFDKKKKIDKLTR